MAIQHQNDTQLKDARVDTTPPVMWQVVLLNDDYTPMDFVIDVLQHSFGMPSERANQVMLRVHTEGRGLCGVYPKDIAATKVAEVTQHARAHQHPLQCIMEVNQ